MKKKLCKCTCHWCSIDGRHDICNWDCKRPIPPKAKMTCASINCPERKSLCCGAGCTIETKDGEVCFVCKKCLQNFVGGACTAISKSTPPKIDLKVAQLYKGKFEECGITFSRVWAMPSAWTFTIHPIKTLLEKYVGNGRGWVDPFAGNNSPAEHTNDHNPERRANEHMEAIAYCKQLKGEYQGVLFDPPYSFTQVKEHYQKLGQKVTKENTSMKFYEGVKSAMCDKIKKGGYAISFGWNTNGFGKTRGFRIVEIMAVAHGGSKNDTFVTVEIKL